MCDTVSESRPVARKAHRCNACHGTIAKGDSYLRQFNVDGRDAWTWKAHLLCMAILRADADPYDDCLHADPGEQALRLREVLTFPLLGRAA